MNHKIPKAKLDKYFSTLDRLMGRTPDFTIVHTIDVTQMMRFLQCQKEIGNKITPAAIFVKGFANAITESKVWERIVELDLVDTSVKGPTKIHLMVHSPEVSDVWASPLDINEPYTHSLQEIAEEINTKVVEARMGATETIQQLTKLLGIVPPNILAFIIYFSQKFSPSFRKKFFSFPVISIVRNTEQILSNRFFSFPMGLFVGEIREEKGSAPDETTKYKVTVSFPCLHNITNGVNASILVKSVENHIIAITSD